MEQAPARARLPLPPPHRGGGRTQLRASGRARRCCRRQCRHFHAEMREPASRRRRVGPHNRCHRCAARNSPTSSRHASARGGDRPRRRRGRWARGRTTSCDRPGCGRNDEISLVLFSLGLTAASSHCSPSSGGKHPAPQSRWGRGAEVAAAAAEAEPEAHICTHHRASGDGYFHDAGLIGAKCHAPASESSRAGGHFEGEPRENEH